MGGFENGTGRDGRRIQTSNYSSVRQNRTRTHITNTDIFIFMRIIDNTLAKLIGDVNPNKTAMINQKACLINRQNTIIRCNNIEDVQTILGKDFPPLQKWIPDPVMRRSLLKQYPFLVMLSNQLKLDNPVMWYQAKGKPLVVEYPDKFYIVSPMIH